MDDNYNEKRLLDVIERLAVGSRVDLEAYKSEQRQSNKEHSDRIRAIEIYVENTKSNKTNNEDKHTISKLLDFIIKIVGILIAAILVLLGLKDKL